MLKSSLKAKIILTLVVIISSMAACVNTDEQLNKFKEYDGPLREVEDVVMHHSDSAIVKMKMESPYMLEFQSGDREFPNGLLLTFFDELGNVKTTIKANEAFYFKSENLWRGREDVVVRNFESNEQLNTEELFWDPDEGLIFTERFVTIRLDEEVLYGRGLEADEEFTWYQIKKPEGEFYIEDE